LIDINLAFLKDKHNHSNDLEESEFRYNQQFRNLVYGCINCPENKTKEADSPNLNEVAVDTRPIIEVECDGIIGSDYCLLQSNELELRKGDYVIVKCGESKEIAKVREVGNFVHYKRQKEGLNGEDLPLVIRKATSEDIELFHNNITEEDNAAPVFKQKVNKFDLGMKLVDVHYQFDKKKLFFFYTADGRVDFRELAKELASQFKTRIELRQIGVRDEAKYIGGIGTCGREYCCSLFLNNFKRITTQLANEQNSSANMSKLSGPCGKLKCCLSFEVSDGEEELNAEEN
jgi:cell fate regulator YaaT (PSP1 superfamily)